MNIIIFSLSSDIGAALAGHFIGSGNNVFGTYRTKSNEVNVLEGKGAYCVRCDVLDNASVEMAVKRLTSECDKWDVLIVAHGTQIPVGLFEQVKFEEWVDSVNINAISQFKIVHGLLPSRNITATNGPIVLFFAGGGTNGPVPYYSAYTLSKISLIKFCELLDSEMPDTRFSIIGPGWVRTKIHNETLKAGEENAGNNFNETQRRFYENKFNASYDDVISSLEWVIAQPKNVVSGRNFSVVRDAWGNEKLSKELVANQDMYKLRRFRNEWKP
jgi:NAD(P)-dependent dehydrogenase (short-subunit alcohol dehydrogenase family)